MHHESMSVSVRVVSKGTLDNVASSADPRDLAGDLTSPRPAQLLARCMDGILPLRSFINSPGIAYEHGDHNIKTGLK